MTSEARRNQCAEAQRRYRARHADRVRAYKRSAPAEKAYQARAYEVRTSAERARRDLLPSWVNEAVVILRALRHSESCARSSKSWRLENAGRVRELSMKHAAIRKGAEASGDVTSEAWRTTIEAFGGACAYCLADDVKLTIDHVQPLSRGGKHSIENIVPACGPCNSAKKDRGILSMISKVSHI